MEGSALQSLFRVARPWGFPLALPLFSKADSYKNSKSLPQLEATQAHPWPARSFW